MATATFMFLLPVFVLISVVLSVAALVFAVRFLPKEKP
jgi:hypothetical protein